jgi:hypothetical protein
MLQMLLDEQISPVIVTRLRERQSKIQVETLLNWQNGKYIASHDEEILAAACVELLTLVTYDRATITPILKNWGEQERNHAGVICIDNFSIAPSNFGGLVRALEALWLSERLAHWNNRIYFLTRPK